MNIYKLISTCSFCFIFSFAFAQEENDKCREIFYLLSKDGLYEYSETNFSEASFRSVLDHYKSYHYEHYEQAQKTGISLGIPGIDDVLDVFGFNHDEKGYRDFIENIDHYYSMYATYKSSFQKKVKKVNADVVQLLQNCFSVEEGVTSYRVSNGNSKSEIVRFRYKAYYGAPSVAVVTITGNTPNVSVKSKQIKLKNGDQQDVIITRTDSAEGKVTFTSNAKTPHGLSVSLAEIRKPEIVISPRVVQQDLIPLQHTYIPPHVKGDKDFDGDCDLFATANLKISDDQTKLLIELYFKAKEPHSDDTEASGTETFLIYDTKDTRKKITKILTGTMDRGAFNSRNDTHAALTFEPYTFYAAWDLNNLPGGWIGDGLRRLSSNFTNDFTRNGLVKRWIFVGDTDSNVDAGSQTKVTIETNTISFLIQEN